MTRQIKVDIVGNSKPLTNALDQAIGKVTGFGDRMRSLGGGNLGKGLAVGAGIAGFNLLTTAIDTGISKLDEFHKAYLDDQASQVRLQGTLQNTVKNYDAAVKAAEDFAAAQINLGFTDDSVRDSLGQLLGMTHDLAAAQDIVLLAEDLARAKNIDLAQATDVLTKAYAGQARGLTALGINTAGASGGAQLLARAFDNVHGAAQKFLASDPGRIAKANAKMDETFEKLGKAVDVVSQVAIPIMQTGLSALVDLAGAIIGAFTTAARVLQENFGPALAAIGDIARAVASPLALLADIGANIIGAVAGSGGGGGNASGQNGNGTAPPTGVTIRKYPAFANGGVVPGPAGSPQMIIAHAGETVTPQGRAASQVININIASFIGSDRDIDRFTDRLAFRLRATSLS